MPTQSFLIYPPEVFLSCEEFTPQVKQIRKIFHYIHTLKLEISDLKNFPGGASGKESACTCRRHKRYCFDLWVGKIPWSRSRQATPVFLSGKFRGQRNLAGFCLWGCKESGTTEYLSTCIYLFIFDCSGSPLLHVGFL